MEFLKCWTFLENSYALKFIKQIYHVSYDEEFESVPCQTYSDYYSILSNYNLNGKEDFAIVETRPSCIVAHTLDLSVLVPLHDLCSIWSL